MTAPRLATSSHLTPYDDAYPTCERAAAVLRIAGDALEPNRVTATLGIAPTEARSKGDVIVNSLGRRRVAPTGLWFLSSEPSVLSRDLRRHLDHVLDQVGPRKAEMLRLQQEAGVTMVVLCHWWSAHGDGGPALWPKQMRALADLNLECAIHFSYYGPDE